jgi:hypothetical protein
MDPRRTAAPRQSRPRLLNHRRANIGAEAAIAQILKIDFLFAPDEFDSAQRRLARLGFALFELMDCPLGQADTQPEFALTPAKHGARKPDLGRERISFKLAKLV